MEAVTGPDGTAPMANINGYRIAGKTGTRDDETDAVNRFNFELHQRYPWIIPFGGLGAGDPDKGAIVDRCLGEYGFLGFKFHPFIQAFDPLDPRMMPAYERLAAWRRQPSDLP